MKTEKTKVEGTCYIWAIPKTDYVIKREIAEAGGDATKVIPFEYIIKSYDNDYRDGAVLVHEFPVMAEVPEGVDLIKAAVKTMREEIAEIQAEAQKKVAALEERIKNLALLTYDGD